MDQKMHVYFMINPDLVGNGQRLHCGKRNAFYFFMFIFGFIWGCVERKIRRVCFLFSHFSFSVFHLTGKHFKILDIYCCYYLLFFIIIGLSNPPDPLR